MPEKEPSSKTIDQTPEIEAAEDLKPVDQESPDKGDRLPTVTVEQLENIGFAEDYCEAVEMAARIEDVVQSADRKGKTIDPEKEQQLLGFVKLAIEKQFANEKENREQLVEIGTRFAFLQGKIQYQLETASLIEQQETLSDSGRKRLFRLVSRLIAEEYIRSQPKTEASQPTVTTDQTLATDIKAPKEEETKAIIEKLGISLINAEDSDALPVQRTADEILISKQALDGEFDQNAALEALYCQETESENGRSDDSHADINGDTVSLTGEESPESGTIDSQKVVEYFKEEGITEDELKIFRQFPKQKEMFALAALYLDYRQNRERTPRDKNQKELLQAEYNRLVDEARGNHEQDVVLNPVIRDAFLGKLNEFRDKYDKIVKSGIDISEIRFSSDDNPLDSGSDQSSEGKGDSDQPIENQRGGAEKEKSAGGSGGRGGDKANLRGFAGFKESLKGFLTTFSGEIEYLNLPAKVLGI